MTTVPAPSGARRRTVTAPAVPPPAADPDHPYADRVHALEVEVAQMRTAMASRAVIEQAKGILMLLTGCSDQVAFDVLTHISSTTHRKVRDLAVAITASACGRSPLPADVQDAIRDVCPPPHAG
ncbi:MULTISPECIES: ANTAR domain-containing protein [unclassified Blastococcus]